MYREVGHIVSQLLDTAVNNSDLIRSVRALLEGGSVEQVPNSLVCKLRELILSVLSPQRVKLPPKSAKANTPLSAELLGAWGWATDDEESTTLASWLRVGAPLGFKEKIISHGVFPEVETKTWSDEAANALARSVEAWSNHPSADENTTDLVSLITDAKEKGFVSIYDSVDQARKELETEPVLNKLGVVAKEKPGQRKARIIWDMRESGINKLCDQGERIILPRLSDVVANALEVFRRGGTPAFLAIDIRDAFHNIPAGKDKAFTAAVVPMNGHRKVWLSTTCWSSGRCPHPLCGADTLPG